jgi:RNA polymerase subunit RPABC4/transcription elongation factor Spt4
MACNRCHLFVLDDQNRCDFCGEPEATMAPIKTLADLPPERHAIRRVYRCNSCFDAPRGCARCPDPLDGAFGTGGLRHPVPLPGEKT